ncbi:MAG: peptidase M42 [Deltaproteobacteria bacterium]|nr:peptidase M42 [Deltaproteobacteria bacterium]MBN2672668.1 peptidase M42 [Deltaproteobacteria bacterium]
MKQEIAQSPNRLPSSFVDLLKGIIRHPAVVGAESSFFRHLQRELEERNATVTWYEGLLVAQGNEPYRQFFSAHIDRHGLICTGPNEFQYAAFVTGARSDLLGNSVSEQFMLEIVDRFNGEKVYAYEPWSGAYLGTGEICNAYICEFRNNLIFEITGLQHVVAGTPVAFRDKLVLTADMVQGQLDNALTAAILVYLFEVGYTGTAFFTAQEEAGKSWRFLLEWFRRFGGTTNQLIVLDTSPFPTYEEACSQDLILRNRDANASFNSELSKEIAAVCQRLNVRTSYKDEYIEQKNLVREKEGLPPLSVGSTELGRIISTSNGLVDGTTLQIPCSGYHTMNEKACKRSILSMIRVLRSLSDAK